MADTLAKFVGRFNIWSVVIKSHNLIKFKRTSNTESVLYKVINMADRLMLFLHFASQRKKPGRKRKKTFRARNTFLW